MSKYEYFSYSNLLNANVWKNNKVHSRLGYTIELNFDWLLWLVEPTNYRYIYIIISLNMSTSRSIW